MSQIESSVCGRNLNELTSNCWRWEFSATCDLPPCDPPSTILLTLRPDCSFMSDKAKKGTLPVLWVERAAPSAAMRQTRWSENADQKRASRSGSVFPRSFRLANSLQPGQRKFLRHRRRQNRIGNH